MRIGFMGLGKLGLPCALAIEEKGHDVCGYDIDPRVAEIISSRSLPYREEGAQEKLKRSNIRLVSVNEMVSLSEIIFVPIQTPHDERYEGCTRIPDTRTDFNYSWLKAGIKELNDAIAEQDKDKVVIIISTVLPGTIKTHILPIINGNDRFHLCYNPFFIAMGTAIWDFTHPEFVLFGTESQYAADVTREFYTTIHDSPFYQTDIINAEMIKVCYNTFIGMKIAYANTIMEMCHKNGGNVDEVMNGIKLATERVISPKYLSGGMGDGGGCVMPEFEVSVNGIAYTMKDLYEIFHSSSEKFYVESTDYTCSIKNNKKISDVTKRRYTGKMYSLTTSTGKKIQVTEDHLIPVYRDGIKILLRCHDIKIDDELFVI
jgi:UDPglucose 6-dehydrogenase